jgi:hypothetical protein
MPAKRDTLTTPPPRFPSLTKTQKTWLAERKRELEAAIQDGRDQLDRGEGRPFSAKRIIAKIKSRKQTPAARTKAKTKAR